MTSLLEVRHYCSGLLNRSFWRLRWLLHASVSGGLVMLGSGIYPDFVPPGFAPGQSVVSWYPLGYRAGVLEGREAPRPCCQSCPPAQYRMGSSGNPWLAMLVNRVLITCRGETLGSIKTQISMKGKRWTFAKTNTKKCCLKRKEVKWIKTSRINVFPWCGSPAQMQRFPETGVRGNVSPSVNSGRLEQCKPTIITKSTQRSTS